MSHRTEPDSDFWPADKPSPLERIGPLRRAVLFALGVAVIIDGLVQSGSNTAELVSGLVLLGLVPIDQWLAG